MLDLIADRYAFFGQPLRPTSTRSMCYFGFDWLRLWWCQDEPVPCFSPFRLCQENKGKTIAGLLGGLVGGPRAYQDQFRGFESHRVHARR